MRSLERTRRGPNAGLAARLTALLVAIAVATPAVAAPADDPAIAEATRIYQQGIDERDAGDHVAAAESFTDAYDKIPPASREIRAAVLFDLVDARRNAFAEGEGPAQLCECERRLVAYSDEVSETFGAKGERFPDTRKARKLLADVRAQIAGLRAEAPDLDCSALRVDKAPPPAPEPIPEAPPPEPPEPPGPDPVVQKQRRDQTLAGGVLVGVGGVFLVVMAAGLGVGRKAERDGTDLTDAATAAGMPLSIDDPSLQDPVRRGKIGNGLAIAGGVIGGVALVTGITLLVLGKRPVPPRRAALRPALAPGFAGAALHLRF